MPVQFIAIVAASLFLFQVIYFTSKHRLRDRQAFSWLIIAIIGLVIAFTIPLINKIAGYLGVSYMPTLVFLIAFLVVLTIQLYQITILSDYQEKTKDIIQEIAYLRKEIKDGKQKK